MRCWLAHRPDHHPLTRTFTCSSQGLAELETYLPSRLLDPRIAAPVKPAKLNYQQRQDAAVQRDLKAINDLLDTAKASKGRGMGECWPAPLKDTADARKSARARTAARNTGAGFAGEVWEGAGGRRMGNGLAGAGALAGTDVRNRVLTLEVWAGKTRG